MRRRLWMKMTAFLLAGSMVFSLTACNGAPQGDASSGSPDKGNPGIANVKSENLMDAVAPSDELPMLPADKKQKAEEAMMNFSVELFKQSLAGDKNTLISPLSVMMALAMTANGAKGETLAQMEAVLGADVDSLNGYLHHYMAGLPQGEKYKLNLANSIWFTDHERFTVVQEFLQKNADYYGADIYRTDFSRKEAIDDINNWIEQKTDGMIKDMLDSIPDEIIMYLINALAFEAEWMNTYEENAVCDGNFTTEAGEKQNVQMMYSDEAVYLEDENTTGFVKYYKDQKYAFAALLPEEGMSMTDYVDGLTGEKVANLLANARTTHVAATMPQFETEYDILMNDVLEAMGMPDAFSGNKADFTGMGTSEWGNIYIGRVLHKTFITVGPQGTKAGAATIVEMEDECAAIYDETKTVTLDRPFVYLLIDCETNQPFFIGNVLSVE